MKVGVYVSEPYGRSLVATERIRRGEEVLGVSILISCAVVSTTTTTRKTTGSTLSYAFRPTLCTRSISTMKTHAKSICGISPTTARRPCAWLNLAARQFHGGLWHHLVAKRAIAAAEHLTIKYHECVKGALNDWKAPRRSRITKSARKP